MCVKTKPCFSLFVLLWLFVYHRTCFSIGVDTISVGQSLSVNQTLVSKTGIFELGFFPRGTSDNIYLGIWYRNFADKTIVWVANRESPSNDPASSKLELLSDGNLVLRKTSTETVWSPALASSMPNTTKAEAVILDDGNFVIRDGSNPSTIFWQSFDYPTDTWLPGAKLGINKHTRQVQRLISWKNLEDPAPGMFSVEIDPNGSSQFFIEWNRSVEYRSSGRWNGQIFTLVPEMRSNYIYNFSYVSNENESYFTYSLYNNSLLSRFVIGVHGQMQQLSWSKGPWSWVLYWSQPRDQAGVYGFCGVFGVFHASSSYCECLKGFKPLVQDDWSSGCVRKSPLQCQNKKSIGKEDGFLKMSDLALPANFKTYQKVSAGRCRLDCMEKCSCMAYTYNNSTGCSLWEGDLIDLQQSGVADGRAGAEIYIRLAASEPELQIGNGSTRTVKSDVFSFGVLVLEIVSGRKNTSFYHSDSLNLLGHAWMLWSSNKASDLMDPTLGDPPSTSMLLRYINIERMCVKRKPCFLLFVLLWLFVYHRTCFSIDTILVGQSLKLSQTLVSQKGIFELGFFSPGTSSNIYLGIWHRNFADKTIVWVANRESPSDDLYSSKLELLSDGNLVLLKTLTETVWSTTLASSMPNTTKAEAVILDDGNFVIRDGSNPSTIYWQSFDYPTDTWLPGAKLGINKRTGQVQRLISWKNSEDPAPGMFSVGIDTNGSGQFFMEWNRSHRYWSSGDWNGQIFSLIPERSLNYNFNYSYVSNENESYLTYSLSNSSSNSSYLTRIVIDFLGNMQHLTSMESKWFWVFFLSLPKYPAEVYGSCGVFGVFQNSSSYCQCLKGFEPLVQDDWSSGCVRKSPLHCQNKKSIGKEDGFLKMSNLTLPANSKTYQKVSAGRCRLDCMEKCSCMAYAYNNNNGCSFWEGDLIDLQQSGIAGGRAGAEIYIRLAASELELQIGNGSTRTGGTIKWKLRTAFAVAIPTTLITLGLFMYFRCLCKGKLTRKGHDIMLFDFDTNPGSTNNESSSVDNRKKRLSKNMELPLFSYESVSVATGQFSDKLGEGGFGPVYKGKLPTGLEVAVKRLSERSGQGLEEFRNETILIAKLQHRNLVRLLGSCIERDEKMLIYDGYMSPEYAMEGLFSIKSDVFSFGVLVLEIVSGKKNTSFYHSDSLHLLGHAWKLWRSNKASDMMDPTLGDPPSTSMLLRYINIGLLCVQESPADRPTMSDVISMIVNEHVALPEPKQPAFVAGRNVAEPGPLMRSETLGAEIEEEGHRLEDPLAEIERLSGGPPEGRRGSSPKRSSGNRRVAADGPSDERCWLSAEGERRGLSGERSSSEERHGLSAEGERRGLSMERPSERRSIRVLHVENNGVCGIEFFNVFVSLI
uniref:non-specific serine/threonine protein kinase n=1 Tax=Salix viminalis TaxID=40686 RepID=A0A6N2KT66_SALVM